MKLVLVDTSRVLLGDPPMGHLVTVWTPPFSVYNAKTFPGIENSTYLTHWLASCGFKLLVRQVRLRFMLATVLSCQLTAESYRMEEFESGVIKEAKRRRERTERTE